MKKIYYQDSDFERQLENLYHRPSYPPEIEDSVKAILKGVRERGDTALTEYARKFDKAELTPEQFLVDDEELKKAGRKVDSECKKAVKEALKNVMFFSEQRIPAPWSCSPRPGVIVGERFEPMDRIGVYVPGGTAPLVSTVIHTAGIARAAGVKEIVAVTPPGPDGEVHPAVLYAMRQAGVTEVYRLGGVYGIAALAYGTESIRKVEKIVGPGNAYVTAAKKLVYGEVAIDMVAGPSEIMIIADGNCNPEFIAADILSQAEHGSGLEQAVLLSTDKDLIDKVEQEISVQKKLLDRQQTVEKVIENGVFLIEVEDLDSAADIASLYAPEHLEIQCARAGNIAKKVRAAGAIFIGQWTPEPIGDFCAGPSHVLPTAGSARFFSGLTVEGFFRRMSIVNYHKSALKKEVDTAVKFAEMEGLDAHGRSASIRFKTEK
ncbi:histidinol dehydrogenase [Lentisphaerota bacterium ZTH]|nr:histidinol dehydrogenase [Lentisphaerota bacterium]WET05868.1 histidinol dehydrogenase [Lentisphaerota bacterium ZTH]